MSYRVLAAAAAFTLTIAPQTSAALNLEKLLNKLGNAGQQSGNNQNPSAGQGNATTAGKSARGGLGSAMTERYCRQMFSTAGFSKKKPIDQSLILDEFNLTSPGDFFDAYMNAAPQSSFTFPEARFYQGEFETDRINVLFDLLLSYPSPQYLAALITEARKQNGMPQYDHQMKIDAVAALTIVHFFLKDYSKTPNRWTELATQLQNEEHYTARVITARLLASGELGVRDPVRALTYAAEANGLRQKYISEQGYRSMSSRNYSVTSNHTVYQIVAANAKMPQSQYHMQFARQYEASLKNPMQFPELESQLGPGLKLIEKSAGSAAQKASEMLSNATTRSRLKAEKGSLDNATRNRVSDNSDLNVDPKTMLALTRQLEKISSLDEQQKQQFASALADAHDSGDRAIAMMPTMMSSMLSLASQRGMAAMPALVPYAKKLQYYSDNACSVIARWDQAALVTQSNTDDSARSSSMAALLNETDNTGR